MDDEHFLIEVEQALGWKLEPELQTQALDRARQGESAPEVAQYFEKLQTGRNRVNDPQAPLHEPPTRPVDDDPREFHR